MATQCIFKSTTFQGICTSAAEGTFGSDVDRSGISGVHGEDEIRMGRRGVPIEVTVWLFGFASDVALKAYVDGVLLPLRNANGTLEITGGVVRTYPNTTLDSFEPADRPSDQSHDPSLGRVQTWKFRFYCLRG